jgi:hypothetical protein
VIAALRSGKPHCARLSGEKVPGSFWQYGSQFDENSLYYGRLDIYGPDVDMTQGRLRDSHPHLDGREFYVFEPEKVWPVLKEAPQATKESGPEESECSKTGPRATNNWQMFVVMKYCADRYKNKGEPTAPDLADACGHEFSGWKPATTAINKLLRELRKILG